VRNTSKKSTEAKENTAAEKQAKEDNGVMELDEVGDVETKEEKEAEYLPRPHGSFDE